MLAGQMEEAANVLEEASRLPNAPPRVLQNLALARTAREEASEGRESGLEQISEMLKGVRSRLAADARSG
jgi:Flp pilus assembly protein TadD